MRVYAWVAWPKRIHNLWMLMWICWHNLVSILAEWGLPVFSPDFPAKTTVFTPGTERYFPHRRYTSRLLRLSKNIQIILFISFFSPCIVLSRKMRSLSFWPSVSWKWVCLCLCAVGDTSTWHFYCSHILSALLAAVCLFSTWLCGIPLLNPRG